MSRLNDACLILADNRSPACYPRIQCRRNDMRIELAGMRGLKITHMGRVIVIPEPMHDDKHAAASTPQQGDVSYFSEIRKVSRNVQSHRNERPAVATNSFHANNHARRMNELILVMLPDIGPPIICIRQSTSCNVAPSHHGKVA